MGIRASMRWLSLIFFAAVLAPLGASACPGPDLAITSLYVASVAHTQYLTLYRVVGTVRNAGQDMQPGNTLQFVDVNQYGNRLDDRGIPPLKPGESYSVSYVWPRAVDAGLRTTPLEFRLRGVSPSGTQVCMPANGVRAIVF